MVVTVVVVVWVGGGRGGVVGEVFIKMVRRRKKSNRIERLFLLTSLSQRFIWLMIFSWTVSHDSDRVHFTLWTRV